jgi:hypothetical protein
VEISSHIQKYDKRLFLLIVIITLIIFFYTNDGHRSTFDEDVTNQEGLRIATMSPDPSFIQGESQIFFEYPNLFPPETNDRSLCKIGILCSVSNIGHSLIESIPIFVNHNLRIISNVQIYENDDYDDLNFVYWKNNLNPDFVFLELVFGPFFSSLSIGIFFLLCRFFSITQRTSILISFFYAFSTLTWAYSQTSLNSIPMIFFLLLGVLFFAKFTKSHKNLHLIFSSFSLAFAFLIRPDVIFAIIPLFVLLLIELKNKNMKIPIFFTFSSPLIFIYFMNRLLTEIRFEIATSTFSGVPVTSVTPMYVGILGLLFSPGVGLFIFAPITLTVFITFSDFYAKNKKFFLLFVSISLSFIIFYSTLEYWHGLVSWGPRYLLPIIPFLLLPLGITFDKRKNKFLKSIIIFLGVLGGFFNFVYVIQNVQWFVWGTMGQEYGLYALARMENGNVHPLWINPITLYTFDYSQLTHSIIWSISYLQIDLFLFELLGVEYFFITLVIFLILPVFYMLKILNNNLNHTFIDHKNT